MRLRREMVQYLAQAVARDLVEKGCVQSVGSRERLGGRIREIIAEDLQVEDRLNDEVKELLRGYSGEFARGEADYHTMFSMVKRKLVHERGLIL